MDYSIGIEVPNNKISLLRNRNDVTTYLRRSSAKGKSRTDLGGTENQRGSFRISFQNHPHFTSVVRRSDLLIVHYSMAW